MTGEESDAARPATRVCPSEAVAQHFARDDVKFVREIRDLDAGERARKLFT